MLHRSRIATATVAALLGMGSARAAAADGCSKTITRDNVVRCVMRASLALERERQEIAALEGRRMAVSPLLPENPKFRFLAAHRSNGTQRAGDWYATLSQEFEVAGQRAARRDQAAAALRAQESVVHGAERSVAASAWQAYFEALAARDAAASAVRLERIFARSTQAAQSGATHGLVSGVDAEIASLSLLRLTHMRIAAERRAHNALAALSSLLGLDPAASQVRADGELAPLKHVAAWRVSQLDAAAAHRSEVARAKQTQEARTHAQTVLERSRVPNITVSLTTQRDGFGELVLGGGVALPIPLPYPIGRTQHGEIAQSAARIRQADAELARVQRAVRLDITQAWHAYTAAASQHALFTPARIEQAERSLTSIASELQAGRLSISDAVLAERTLVEFLRAHVDAKLELCLASIDLAHSAGLPLQGAGL